MHAVAAGHAACGDVSSFRGDFVSRVVVYYRAFAVHSLWIRSWFCVDFALEFSLLLR